MTDDALKEMKKQVSGKKRIATELASQIHDLVEDRLLSDYSDLPGLAAQTVAACEEWRLLNAEYQQAAKAEA